MATMPDLPSHSYEEIRDIVIDILLKKEPDVNQFSLVLQNVEREIARRHRGDHSGANELLNSNDKGLVLEVFWDLFRQGFISRP
jgi:hypothetical protein